MAFGLIDSSRRRARAGIRVALAAVWLLGGAACSDTPIEALTLSETAIEEMGEAHRAHRALAERYFARMRDDVEVFLDRTWRPYIVERTLLETPSGRGTGAVAETIAGVVQQISLYRAALMQPIDAQERAVLRGIDDIYARVRQSHAILVGRLASDERIERAQNDIRNANPLKKVRQDHVNATAALSHDVAELVARAGRGESSAAEIAAQLCDLVNSARGRVDGVATGTLAGADRCKARTGLPRE